MAALAEKRREMLDAITRDAIYEGAVAVLQQEGLRGTTMDRVAAAAGVAKGSLYNYFRNKQELLEFVHDRALSPLDDELRDLVARDLPAEAKLETIIRSWRRHLADNQAIFEFLINDAALRGRLEKSKRTARASGIQLLAQVFDQGVAEGCFRPMDTRMVAEMFLGAAIETVEQEFARGAARDVEVAVHTLAGVFLRGVVTRESG